MSFEPFSVQPGRRDITPEGNAVDPAAVHAEKARALSEALHAASLRHTTATQAITAESDDATPDDAEIDAADDLPSAPEVPSTRPEAVVRPHDMPSILDLDSGVVATSEDGSIVLREGLGLATVALYLKLLGGVPSLRTPSDPTVVIAREHPDQLPSY